MWHYSMLFLQATLQNTFEGFTFASWILKFLAEETRRSPLIYNIIMEETELMLRKAICHHKILIGSA